MMAGYPSQIFFFRLISQTLFSTFMEIIEELRTVIEFILLEANPENSHDFWIAMTKFKKVCFLLQCPRFPDQTRELECCHKNCTNVSLRDIFSKSIYKQTRSWIELSVRWDEDFILYLFRCFSFNKLEEEMPTCHVAMINCKREKLFLTPASIYARINLISFANCRLQILWKLRMMTEATFSGGKFKAEWIFTGKSWFLYAFIDLFIRANEIAYNHARKGTKLIKKLSAWNQLYLNWICIMSSLIDIAKDQTENRQFVTFFRSMTQINFWWKISQFSWIGAHSKWGRQGKKFYLWFQFNEIY